MSTAHRTELAMHASYPDETEAGFASERLVLWPQRSLGPRGCAVLLSAFSVLFIAISVWAVAKGAWPLALYAGLAMGGLAFALICNNRAARQVEIIELAPHTVRVSWEGPASKSSLVTEFNPHWVQIVEAPGAWDDKRLLLRQGGRSLEIGRFLSPDERAGLAAELKQCVARRYSGH